MRDCDIYSVVNSPPRTSLLQRDSEVLLYSSLFLFEYLIQDILFFGGRSSPALAEVPSRRRFLRSAGAALAGGAVVGGAAYLLDGGVRTQVSALTNQVAGLNSTNSGLKQQNAVLNQQNNQLQTSSGVVGYAFGKGRVAALDLNQQRLISTAPISALADTSLSFAHSRLDGRGREWGGVGKTGQVYAIDPVTAEVVSSIQLPGRWAILLADMDPKGQFVYVLNLLVAPNASDADLAATNVKVADIAPSVLYKIDTTNFAVVGSLEVARFACDTSLSPDGRYFYIPNQLDTLVTILDLSTFKVVDVIRGTTPGEQIGGSMITTSPSGKLIFLENSPSHNWSKIDIQGENSEIVIDSQTRQIVKTIPFDESPGVDEFTPDGRYAIVTLRTKVAIIDTQSLTVVASPAIAGPGRPSYSPDSSFAYVPSSADNSIKVIEMKTFTVSKSIALPSAVNVIIPFDPKGRLGFKLYPAAQ